MAFIVNFLSILFQVLTFAIFIRALLSFFPIRPDNPLVVIVSQITDPVLMPLRRIIPSIGMFDISPMIAIVLLQILQASLQNLC